VISHGVTKSNYYMIYIYLLMCMNLWNGVSWVWLMFLLSSKLWLYAMRSVRD